MAKRNISKLVSLFKAFNNKILRRKRRRRIYEFDIFGAYNVNCEHQINIFCLYSRAPGNAFTGYMSKFRGFSSSFGCCCCRYIWLFIDLIILFWEVLSAVFISFKIDFLYVSRVNDTKRWTILDFRWTQGVEENMLMKSE